MIVKAEEKDAPVVAALAAALWPHHRAGELELEFHPLLSDPEAAGFLMYEEDCAVGFAEANRIICFTKKLKV